MTEGDRKRMRDLTALTLLLSSGGTSTGTRVLVIYLNMKSAIPHSLLKYETPILVSSSYKSQSAQSKRPSSQMSAKPADPSEDYLNKILPPQEISENNQLWVRYVSATPATTFDVTNLAKDLEKQITT
jgi:hypothetical protein